jgi:hypothetical protein
MTEIKAKKIDLDDNQVAIIYSSGVTIREEPSRAFSTGVSVDYEDLAKILEEAFQPSAVPKEEIRDGTYS